jgi:predicted dehydrogenase
LVLSYASRSAERAEEYRRRFGGLRAFGDYAAACASPDVDAVFVCTPHRFHAEHAALAARNGKHVLIEKPVTRNLSELASVEAAVTEAGVLSMVAENYFFKPLARVLREHVDAGDIGQLLFVELNRTNRRPVRGWRADADMMGGGALLEGGVHWVNLLCSIAGRPTAVIAARPEAPYPMIAPFEDSLEVLVRFAGGAVGKLLHSWNLLNRAGGLQLSRMFGSLGNVVFESNGLFALVTGRRTRMRFPGVLDIMGFRGMLQHFVDSVRRGTPPSMSLAVARRDLAFVAAAYRSLETGRMEPVADATTPASMVG